MDAASYMQRIKAMVWLIESAFTVALLAGCVLRSEAAAPLCYGTGKQSYVQGLHYLVLRPWVASTPQRAMVLRAILSNGENSPRLDYRAVKQLQLMPEASMWGICHILTDSHDCIPWCSQPKTMPQHHYVLATAH